LLAAREFLNGMICLRKMARDIMKELNLKVEQKALVHEALASGAQDAGRKLTYQEGLTAVKELLGLLR
jgi:hypothetical protein